MDHLTNVKNKKFAASYSGGKDSIFALYRAIQQGMEPLALLITYNNDCGRSWFHGLPQDLLAAVSRSLQIPIVMIPTNDRDYEKNFRAELCRQKQRGAEFCIFGDIDIEGHRAWCAGVCEASGLTAYFPLWQESRAALVNEFIQAGFTAHITVVDSSRLGDCYLGMVLSQPVLESIAADGSDVCGENGEYHSFVSDGPLFSHPVAFGFGDVVRQQQYRILPLICREEQECPAT